MITATTTMRDYLHAHAGMLNGKIDGWSSISPLCMSEAESRYHKAERDKIYSRFTWQATVTDVASFMTKWRKYQSVLYSYSDNHLLGLAIRANWLLHIAPLARSWELFVSRLNYMPPLQQSINAKNCPKSRASPLYSGTKSTPDPWKK